MRTLAGVAPVASPDAAILAAIGKLSRRRHSTQTVGRALGRNPMTADVAARIGNCASRLALALEFQDDETARALITGALFCQARLCPFCEWRRTRVWTARLLTGLRRFEQDYPTHRGIFVTLTVRNVPIHQTGETIKHLHASFGRMVRDRFWPSPFYLRRTEITIGQPSFTDDLPSAPSHPKIPGGLCSSTSDHDGQGPPQLAGPEASPYGLWAHPHVHCLLLVPASYWGRNYVRQGEWQRQWAGALGIDYAPVVDVRRVTSKEGSPVLAEAASDAVMEAAKYITKGNDIGKLGNAAAEMHLQLKGQRMIQLSQKLGKYVRSGDIQSDEMLDSAEVEASDSPMFHTVVQWDSLLSEYRIAP